MSTSFRLTRVLDISQTQTRLNTALKKFEIR